MYAEHASYTNYQTATVARWLNKETDTREALVALANGDGDYNQFTSDAQRAEFLKGSMDEYADENLIGEGMFTDLVRHAMGQVDFMEIIRAHKRGQ